ncbi:MAG TPA: nucleotide disphospho-sugar-binding domain-containing protein [Capillimicrobium sp.]|jgi:MGT family glycosyltransferase
MSTVLAYTSPAAGHAFPLVPGLLELQRRGHTVHLRTDPDLVRTIRAAGLHVQSVDPRIPAMKVADHASRSARERLQRGLNDLLARGDLERADLDRAVADVDPDVILVDCNAYGAAVAAQASDRPWATTLPTLLPLPGRGIPPYGLGLRPRSGPLGAARDRLLWRGVVRAYGGAMLPRLNALRAGAGLDPLASPIEHVLAPDRVLVLTGEPLEYPRRDAPPSVRFCGAQSWDPPAEPPAWLLEDGDPWVLVTCSTEYQSDERLAATAIEALRDEPVRVAVTMADAYGAPLPRAANARVERFVPHAPLLARAAAVVCPGGMGVTQKAIAAGVPVVAVPFGRDQPEVARRVVECGAGVRLTTKRLSPERLRAAVRRAIALRPSAQRAGERLREAGGSAALATAVEGIAPPQRSRAASSTRERTSSLA